MTPPDSPIITGRPYRLVIEGQYGDADGCIRIVEADSGREAVMWDASEWTEDPSLVFVIAHAIEMAIAGSGTDADAGDTVTLSLHISNAYSTGEIFVHDIVATVPAPPGHPDQVDTDSDELADWAGEHLLALTGQGPEYADVDALYEVTITGAPDGFGYLVGYETAAQG